MEAAKNLEAAVKDSPAYGARNVSIVTAGTGEALPGPAACGCCCRSVASYNRFTPGNGPLAGWASEAAVVPVELQDSTTCGDGKGRCFVGAQCLRGGAR
jgi:hypothetical protein